MITEPEMREIVTNALYDIEENECIPIIKKVTSFIECGMMTNDEGVVVEMEDGTEFQITIVQSRGLR